MMDVEGLQAKLSSSVFQAIGAASTCWENMAGTGVFDSDRARQIGLDLMEELAPVLRGAVRIVPATVARVVDGDTVRVRKDLGWYLTHEDNMRLAYINAPELTTVEGQAAKTYLSTLLPMGCAVTVTSHSLDKYGRTLGTITMADGRDVGEVMVSMGFAVPYMAMG